MENKEIDLLPCPFCGGEALNVVQWVECDSCGAFGPTTEPYGDLSNWNRRTPAITTVDLASADASGYRNGRESVVVELPMKYSDDSVDPECMAYNDAVDLCRAAIIAAGGSVKE